MAKYIRHKLNYRKPKKFYKKDDAHETQASRVIEYFGGVKNLTQSLKEVGFKINMSSVYRWTYPKNKGGTGGLIPTAVWPQILKCARIQGVWLDNELISPRESIYKIHSRAIDRRILLT